MMDRHPHGPDELICWDACSLQGSEGCCQFNSGDTECMFSSSPETGTTMSNYNTFSGSCDCDDETEKETGGGSVVTQPVPLQSCCSAMSVSGDLPSCCPFVRMRHTTVNFACCALCVAAAELIVVAIV